MCKIFNRDDLWVDLWYHSGTAATKVVQSFSGYFVSAQSAMYTLYMALHINNSDVEQKVRRMAAVTGETITDAIGRAAEERTKRAVVGGLSRDPSVEDVLALVRSFKLEAINEGLSEDEILGYGAKGYCE